MNKSKFILALYSLLNNDHLSSIHQFFACAEGLMNYSGVKFFDIEDKRNEAIAECKEDMGADKNNTERVFCELESYDPYTKLARFNEMQEYFIEAVNSQGMTSAKFEAICLDVMNFKDFDTEACYSL